MTIYDDFPLHDATKDFRLLLVHDGDDDEIWCTVSVQERKASTWIYTAISYTWGDKTATKIIRVNGQPVQVLYNAWYALWQMRLHRPWQLYWIDSVCIDQSNDRERNQQVAVMDKIYASSLKVAACIGPAGVDFDDYMATVDRFQNRSTAVEPREYLSALQVLSKRSYAHRMWIIQELLLAPYIFFFCGDQMLPMHKFAPENLLARVRHSICDRRQLRDNKLAQLLMDIGSCDIALRLSTLPAIIMKYADSQCSDPRDKLYGLLSLASDRKLSRIPINYGCPLLLVLQDYVKMRCRMPATNLYDFGADYFSIVSLIREFARDQQCLEDLLNLELPSGNFGSAKRTQDEFASISLPGVGQTWDTLCCGETFPALHFPTSFIAIDIDEARSTAKGSAWRTMAFPRATSKSFLHVPGGTLPGDFLLSIRLEHQQRTPDDSQQTILRFVCRPHVGSPTRWDIISRAELYIRPEDVDRPSPGCVHGVGMHNSRHFGFAKLMLHPYDLLNLALHDRRHSGVNASLPMAFTGNCSYFQIIDRGDGDWGRAFDNQKVPENVRPLAMNPFFEHPKRSGMRIGHSGWSS